MRACGATKDARWEPDDPLESLRERELAPVAHESLRERELAPVAHVSRDRGEREVGLEKA